MRYDIRSSLALEIEFWIPFSDQTLIHRQGPNCRYKAGRGVETVGPLELEYIKYKSGDEKLPCPEPAMCV